MRFWHTLTVASALATAPVQLSGQDMILDSAETLLRSGASWQATQLLQPRLNTTSTRTPQVMMAAALAAADWQGWSTVWSLLHGKEWVDRQFDQIGHRLLAEAALSRNDFDEALGHAQLAMPRTLLPRNEEEMARRWIVLARAHQSKNNPDSAAAAYTMAASLFPEVSDWLALRAASITVDSATRARLYTTVTNPIARQRVLLTEAGALSRQGYKQAAAPLYAEAGDLGTSLRLRWEATTSPRSRADITREAMQVVKSGSPAAEIRQVLDLIESYRLPMTASESLTVARSSASRRPRFAVRLYRGLDSSGQLQNSDLIAWGDAHAATGDWSQAATVYKRITTGPRAGEAAYYAARADLRSNKMSAAIGQLNEIPKRYPDDTVGTSTALYLLSDLALDAGRPDSARSLLRRLADDYPTGQFAPRGALIAPLIAFAAGDYRTAQRELHEAIRDGVLTGFNGDAARYWLARSHAALGNSDAARTEYLTLLNKWPENYYAIKAAARLDTVPRLVGVETLTAGQDGGQLPAALARAHLLHQLGMESESRLELNGYGSSANTGPELLQAGDDLLRAGHPSIARRFAQRAVSAGMSPSTVWHLTYPLPYQNSLIASSEAVGLNPWQVAAVIKQESWFEPTATSVAGARGLMQIMPSVGKSLARRVGISGYDDALLWQPEVSLGLGTLHFRDAMRRYPERERALAAYNAGGTRVRNWSRTLLDGSSAGDGPIDDIELWVERIPYLETRGYIRNITVNETMYRLLYGN